MNAVMKKLTEELDRQGLVETVHFMRKMKEMPVGQIQPHWLELQTMWSLAALETRIQRLESEAGIKVDEARLVPDEEGLAALTPVLEEIENRQAESE